MNLFTLISKEISNKNFFVSLICLLIISIISLFSLIIFAYKLGYNDPEIELINYQFNKLKKKNVNIIFIGDSSLGNLIDSSTWENLTKKSTLNLALTGKFQYKGNLALIKKISNKKKIKINIISSFMNWSIGEKNLYNIINHYDNIFFRNYYLVWFNLNRVSIKKIISFYLGIDKDEDNYNYIKNDYIVQGKIINEKNLDISFLTSIINLDKIKSLENIKNYCDFNGLDCEFFHGPIAKKICNNNKFGEYLIYLNKNLKKNNLKFNDNFICFDQKHIGDGEDHINNNFKTEYTKVFYNLIKN